MIEVKNTSTLVCDGCCAKGERDEIRSYHFQHTEHDGHRDDWTEDSVELCRRCQNQAYQNFKADVAAMREKK